MNQLPSKMIINHKIQTTQRISTGSIIIITIMIKILWWIPLDENPFAIVYLKSRMIRSWTGKNKTNVFLDYYRGDDGICVDMTEYLINQTLCLYRCLSDRWMQKPSYKNTNNDTGVEIPQDEQMHEPLAYWLLYCQTDCVLMF